MENYRGISLRNACFKLYSESSNENLKVKAEKFLSECQMDFEHADLASIHYLVCNYYRKRREFHDYVKAFDRVKRENCLKNYKAKTFPIYYDKV